MPTNRGPSTGYDVIASATADRADPYDLHGAEFIIGDEIYAFVANADGNIANVEFVLNGERIQNEYIAPWDIAGGDQSRAAGLNTGGFAAGDYTLETIITYDGGGQSVTLVDEFELTATSGSSGPSDPMIPAGINTIDGNATSQTLVGTDARDHINALAGKDTVYGLGDDDFLYGGLDGDEIYGGDGADFISGDAGNDTLQGGSGNDEIYGGDGDDTLYVAGGSNRLFGDLGNDYIVGGASADVMEGGPGNDRLFGKGGDDVIRGGAGDDVTYGGSGDDSIFGDAGSDNIVGGSGNDIIAGGAGDDEIQGGDGNDDIAGGDGNDRIFVAAGSNNLTGDGGNDYIIGSPGEDLIYGNEDNDRLYGKGGIDWIDGGDGDDEVFGDAGNDTLFGGDGADRVFGGAGDDVIEGGPGDGLLYYGAEGDDVLFGMSWGGEPVPVLDPSAQVEEDEPLEDDDVFLGAEGNDTYIFRWLIDAKPEVLTRNTVDGDIDYRAIAINENELVHDHWVETIGDDLVRGFNPGEDTLVLEGHTVALDRERSGYFSNDDVGVNNDTLLVFHSINMVRAARGLSPGAHEGDDLGSIVFNNVKLDFDEVEDSIVTNVFYGLDEPYSVLG